MAIDSAALSASVETRNADDIVADALDLLATRMPEWVPRNGSPEVVYLEALAQAAAEVAVAANGEVGAVVESVLADLYQVPRLAGSTATGSLTLTFDTAVSTVVPSGTSFLVRDYAVELVTTADVTVTAATTATLPVATATATSAVNGLGPTAAIDVLDALPNALSVAVTSATTLSGGSDPESDSAYIARAQNRLARVTSSLIVADHFTAYVLEDGQASNAVTIPAWNGTAIGTAGTDTGHVTTVTYGRGAQLSAGVKTALASAMQAITAAGTTVHVVDASLQTVAVTATVHPLAGYSSPTVQANVVAALQAYLAPETWVFGSTVRTTSLTAVIAAAAGVDYVTSLTLPAADVTLTANQLATYGTLTITVA